MFIFNRILLSLHRDRSANQFARHNFLLKHTAQDITERVCDYKQEYDLALDLGCYSGEFQKCLPQTNIKIRQLIQTDISYKMLQKTNGTKLQVDEELLPFAENVFDLVVSNLNLHWINDLPGVLMQINHILKPQGIFVATILGGKTLIELRKIFIEAESSLGRPVSSRISPMIDAADTSSLLQRAKFSKVVTDVSTMTISYPDINKLMLDLRGMAQSNCLDNVPAISSDTLQLAQSLYQEKYSDHSRLIATYEIITLRGIK